MRRMKCLMILLLTISVLFFIGCGKLTEENYNKIKVGMDYTEVLAIIGSPSECSSKLGVKTCIWGDEEKQIKINFVADKVGITSKKGL